MNNKEKLQAQIELINEEIAKQGDVFELYYKRGYFYFLSGDEQKAKDDYKTAMSFGLDATEYPYYSFSNDNSIRREFLLPEKIMVFLLLLIIIGALVINVYEFVKQVVL